MITFITMVGAVVVGFLIIGGMLAVLPKKPAMMHCAFCGEASRCENDIVKHVKKCKAHPLKNELDAACEHVRRVCEQRNGYREELETLSKVAHSIAVNDSECRITFQDITTRALGSVTIGGAE